MGSFYLTVTKYYIRIKPVCKIYLPFVGVLKPAVYLEK